MLVSILDCFKLPPIDKRSMIEGRVRDIFYPLLRKDRDDTYIYYLVMRNSFVVCAIFSAIYMASRIFDMRFDFAFFEIYVGGETFVRDAIWSYPFVVATALLVLFIPYAWILFKANIDMKKYDLLWWAGALLEKTGGSRRKIIASTRVNTVIGVVAMYGASCLPHMIMQYRLWVDLAKSEAFLLVVLLLFSWAFSGALYLIVASSAIRYQAKYRLGPRFNGRSD